jgi:WD40 repeat protein
MKAEREALQQNVFPKLRDFCQQNGCRFQAIDLRWGVSEEAGLDQRTMTICLGELKRCQKVSQRANCILLLGNRYGWQPLPPRIEAAEMESLFAQLTAPELQRVRRWYQEDRNAVPAEYVLLPRTGEFMSSSGWQPEEHELLRILRRAADAALADTNRRAWYRRSATHHEIVAALLDTAGAEQHVFACFRDLPDLPRTAGGAGFADLTPEGMLDQSAWDRQEALKEEIRNRLPAQNVYSYTGPWPYAPDRDTLGEFCRRVEAHFRQIIGSEMSGFCRVGQTVEENRDHFQFARDRASLFIGRKELLARIEQYLRGNEPYPLFLHGPSGSGKTALMARAFLNARQDWGSSALMFARLVGATPRSTSLHALLGDLLGQLDAFLGNEGAEVPGDINGRVTAFAERLSGATAERPVVIFLDALDQLESSEKPETLFWLPRKLPRHVRLVASVLERSGDLAGQSAEFARRIFPAEAHYLIEPLQATEGAALLDGWLGPADRTLQPAQRETLLVGLAESGLPLWLRLATDQALGWRSFDAPKVLAPTIPALIGCRINEVSLPQNHGELLAARVFGYLSAAQDGLSEDELLDVLARDPELWSDFVNTSRHAIPAGQRQLPVVLWSRLHLDLRGFFGEALADRSRLIGFYHRLIGETISKSFRSPILHSRLADYFSQDYRATEADSWKVAHEPSYHAVQANQPSALRALTELPVQLNRAKRIPELACLLRNYEFLTAKCAANRSDALVEDLDLLAAHGGRLPIWDRFLRDHASLLRRGDAVWPAHRILWQLSHDVPESHPIRVTAEKWFERFRPTEPLLIRAHSHAGEGGPIPRTVELPKDLLDCHETSRLRRIRRLFRSKEREIGCVAPLPDSIAERCDGVHASETEVLPIGEDALLVRYSEQAVAVLSQKTGRVTARLETGDDRIHTLEVFGTILIVLTDSGHLQLLDVSTGASFFLVEEESAGAAGAAALNGKQFLVGYRDGRLVVRERSSGRIVVRKECRQEISRFFVLPNGHVLVGDATGHVTLLSPALEPLFAGDLLKSPVQGAGQLVDGKWVLWDDSGGLTLLDWTDLARFRRLEGHRARTEGILPADDGGFIAWCVDSVIQHWKPGQATLRCLKIRGNLGQLVKGPDDTLLVIYVDDPMQTDHTKNLNERLLAQFATQDRERVYYFADLLGLISISASTFSILDQLEPHMRGGILGAFVVAGQQLVTWCLAGPVAFWEFNGRKIRELPEIELRTLDRLVFLSPQRFLSVHTDGRVRLWNAIDGSAVADLSLIQGRVHRVKTLTGDRFATLTEDLCIRIWDTATGRPLTCLLGHGSTTCGLLQCTHQKLVSWTRQEIKFWDLDEEAGTQEARPVGRPNQGMARRGGGMPEIVRRVSATSIVSCHWGVIKSWNVRSGEMLARLDLIPDMINCLEVVCPDVVLFWCRGFTIWHDVYMWRVTEPQPWARFELFKDSTNVDDVWVQNVGSPHRPIYEICLQGADETEFVFRFDDQLRTLDRPSAVEDGLLVFRASDFRASPLTARGTQSPYERQEARGNVESHRQQCYVSIKTAAGDVQWHSTSPTAFVERHHDGLYCVAQANGEVELLCLR